MQDKIDKLCKDGFWVGETSNTMIEAFETILAVTFPDDYKYFVRQYGSGSKNGIEIAGYHLSIHSDQNIVGKTIYELRDYYFYPEGYLFISDTGDGGQICMDSNSWEIAEIYQNRAEKSVQIKKIASSFLEFLELSFG